MTERTILVIGATGTQGRPVVERLLASETTRWTVHAFTRDPKSEKARALQALDAERVVLVQGSVDDAASLASSLENVDAVFCNTDFFSSMSVRTEYEQGVRVLESAREAGVEHVVYSSLDNAAGISGGRTPVPHYDAKAAVEGWIDMMRSDEFMRQEVDGWYSCHVTVLVTAPYYENVQTFFAPQWGELSDGREGWVFAMAAGGKPHPMIGAGDIAWFAEHALEHQAEWGGRTLRLIAESLTVEEIAAAFERASGVPAEGRDLPLEVIEGIPGVGHDLANMHRFFQSGGITRDEDVLVDIHPKISSFEAWIQSSGWRPDHPAAQSAA